MLTPEDFIAAGFLPGTKIVKGEKVRTGLYHLVGYLPEPYIDTTSAGFIYGRYRGGGQHVRLKTKEDLKRFREVHVLIFSEEIKKL